MTDDEALIMHTVSEEPLLKDGDTCYLAWQDEDGTYRGIPARVEGGRLVWDPPAVDE